MNVSEFLGKVKQEPLAVTFDQTMETVDANYEFTPTAFINGMIKNEAGQNNGSCKLFAFAQLNGLSTDETLACFGDFYRKDVLENPDSDNHQNIRNFISNGWEGIEFDGEPLKEK